MPRLLRALIVEDSPEDADLLVRHLKRAGYDPRFEIVQTAAELESALQGGTWDIVLSDFAMPGFSGLDAFACVRASGLDIPFIIVSGNIGEDRAVESLKRGVDDYVLKSNLARLAPAIERELDAFEQRKQQSGMEQRLLQSERRYRALVEGSREAIAIIQDSKLAFANSRLAEIFSGPARVHIGQLDELRARFQPSERERIDLLLSRKPDSGTLEQGQEFHAERVDGSPVVLHVMAWPIDWEGAPATQVVLADVTDLKRSEAVLRSQKHLLDIVFESMPQQLSVKDRELRYVLANARLAEVSGTPAERLIGKTRAELGYGTSEELSSIEQLDREVLESGRQHVERACPVTMPNGELRHFDVVRTPIRDELGNVLGLMKISTDVTEQQRAEDALLSSQRLFSTVFDSLPAWVAVKDLESRYVMSNPRVREILGLAPDQVLGKRYDELGFGTPTELEGVAATDRAVLEEGRVIEEFAGVRTLADGRELRVNVRRAPLRDGAGKVQGIVLVSWDVTQHVRAEEALARQGRLLSTVFDSLPIWVVVKDPEGRYVAANRAFLRALGLEMDFVIGKRLRDLGVLDDSSVTEYEAIDHDLVATGAPKLHSNISLRLKDGRTLTLSTVRAPLFDSAGHVEGFVILSQDVTERMALEFQFRQSQKMESIGRLAGGVAHDFNNMLAVILAFAELVMDGIQPEDPLRNVVSVILRAARRASELTRQLLAFSRRQLLELQPVNLNAVIQSIERVLGRLLGEDILLRSNLQPDLPLVTVDEGQIEQVLFNLAVNARDAMPDGGTLTMDTRVTRLDTLQLGAHIELPPGEYVQLGVIDTGVGMDENVRSHIFEPFFTTKEKGKGTGLGLSTVYGIVTQFGGAITVHSEPGKGTSFKIFLPLAEPTAQLQSSKDGQVASETSTASIFLVEDEQFVRIAAIRILEKAGYTVYSAASGEEALAMLPELPDSLDMLLSDVVMTGMEGPAMAAKVLEQRPRLRVLFMSGYTDLKITQQGLLSVRHAFLQKPFTRASLLDKVREVLAAPVESPG